MPKGVYFRSKESLRSLRSHLASIKPPSLSIEERLEKFKKVDPVTGCWIWTGFRSKSNYGRTKFRGKATNVHRVVAILKLGLKEGEFALHKCDNPPCFNPDHLFNGSAGDNSQDSLKKGRHWQASKTHCSKGHSYSGKNLGFKPNGRHRICKTCRVIYQRQKESL